MARDISIAISAKDNFSDAVIKMKNAGVHFNKNLEEMQAQLKALNSNRATLKIDTKEAQKNLQALQKEYSEALKKSKDGVVSKELLDRLNTANEEYERMRQNMSMLDKSARETEKSMLSATGVFSKLENRSGSSGGSSLLAGLQSAGIMKMIGDAAGNYLSYSAYSRLGTPEGDVLGATASGIASGMALGTIVPGIGTAVGAVLGGVSGLVNGYASIETNKDEAFKSAVQEQYNTISGRRAEELSTGTSIAAQRELDKIAFDKILKGDSTGTLEAVKTMANTTPFLYEDLKGITKTLATYGTTDPEAIKKRLTQIGDTGAALGMSSADMSMVATGLGRMQSSGKTTLEYLNLLIERGIPAVDYLAEAMGTSNTEVYNMVSKGLIPGAEAAEAIANAMGEANSGAMAEMAETYSGLTSTREGLEQELQASMGAGFTETRTPMLEKLNAQLDPESELGQKMHEAYRLIGVYKGDLQNAQEQAWIDAMTGAMESDEYLKAAAEGDGAKMGEILAAAEAEAETAYREGPAYQKYLETEKSTVQRLQVALADDWENFGYEMGLVFTKGRMAANAAYIEQEQKRIGYTPGAGVEYASNYEYGGAGNFSSPLSGNESSDAYGLSYVPYDNYPARLHEGERVLTAAEARAYNTRGGGAVVQKLADTIVVREDADIDRIASELARKLREMQMVS